MNFKILSLVILISAGLGLIQAGYLDLANDKYQQGLYSEAINLAEKELAENPQDIAALKLLGKAYFAINNFDQAINYLEQALKLNPEDSEIIDLLNQANRAKQEQIELSIEQYTNYLIRHPGNDEYRLKLARAYQEAGDYPSAQKEYEIYLKHNPGDEAVKEENLKISPQPTQEKPKKCPMKKAKQKAKKSSFDLAAILDKARESVGRENYVRAESLYDIYLAKKPGDITVRKEYAQVLSWNKQYDKSIAEYRKLLILNPDDRQAAFELAQVLSWAEKYEEAIALYQTLDTTNIEIMRGLAEAYYWQGSYAKARRYYEKILSLDPKDNLARERIAEIKRKEVPGPEFSGDITNIWDSEDFTLKSYSPSLKIYLSENTSLEPGFAYRQFSQKGDAIIGYSYSIGISEKFSEMVNGNIHYAYNYYDMVDNTHSYGILFNYLPKTMTDFAFSYDHHDIIYDVYTTRSLIQGIATDNFMVEGGHRFEKGYGIAGSYLYGIYSDENHLQNIQARLLYQLFEILRIGYAYNLINYANISNWYWSPDFYQTHSIWFELANGSKTSLSYYLSAEIGKVTNSSGLAKSIGADFSYNPSDNFTLGFRFSYSESNRTINEPSYWSQLLSVYLRFKL